MSGKHPSKRQRRRRHAETVRGLAAPLSSIKPLARPAWPEDPGFGDTFRASGRGRESSQLS